MTRYTRIGLTGANGTIGRVLMDGLGDQYQFKAFTRRPVDFPSTLVNFDRAAEVEGAFEGLDAVIHMAADPSPMAPWESVRDHNLEGMYQVLEECRRSGVKRLVFASTNHTQHGNTILTTPETLDPGKQVRMRLDDPPNPDSMYAVSKLFGENMGKLYSQRFGLEFVGLRIGWIVVENDPTIMRGTPAEDYMRAMFLSHRDCIQAHRRALEVDTQYLLAYVVSNNGRRVFDLQATQAGLGFAPEDDAEDFFAGADG
ncbi:MAG: NAD-dependent epimerase/dehydratase family protein [Candidatus Latescibacteria bacterium]|nr:NAD-dependent epimerase/dehydratase family protein [Candidatus Latescibacterota bacterium]